eukprot:447026-Pelagomonas_calceolata.AAC.1
MTLVISAVPSQAFKMLAEFLKLGSVSDLLTNEKLVKAGTKVFKYLEDNATCRHFIAGDAGAACKYVTPTRMKAIEKRR